MTCAEKIAEDWLLDDQRQARDPREADAMGASRAARACIVELWLESAGGSSDGHGAFAQLGRILADEQVSCASALGCVESFARILPCADHASLAAARCALADAFVEARLEHERSAARARSEHAWSELADGVAAVIAAPPDDDAEWLQDWADRIAVALLRRKIRHAFVNAPQSAQTHLHAALSLVGIEIVSAWPETPRSGGWRRLFAR